MGPVDHGSSGLGGVLESREHVVGSPRELPCGRQRGALLADVFFHLEVEVAVRAC